MVLASTARIAPAADGSFSYDRAGMLALILAVEDCHGNFVDAIAWRDPSPWWLRRGDQTPILGARTLAEATWYGEPVMLYATPESWLRAHRPGGEAEEDHCIAVLRWDVDLRPLFEGVRSVQCETPALGRCLHDALHQFDPVIELFSTGARHAA